MTNAQTFNSLPKQIQLAVGRDWVHCRRNNIMRGEGMADHYRYLLMIAQENDMAITDLLTTADN